ncbi:protein of unknown function [Pseudomonas mediterranea]
MRIRKNGGVKALLLFPAKRIQTQQKKSKLHKQPKYKSDKLSKTADHLRQANSRPA